MSLACTVSEILSLISQNLKKSCDSEHIPLGVIYHACTSSQVLFCIYQLTKFEVPSFTDSTDTIEGKTLTNAGHVTLTTPIGGSLSSQS